MSEQKEIEKASEAIRILKEYCETHYCPTCLIAKRENNSCPLKDKYPLSWEELEICSDIINIKGQ